MKKKRNFRFLNYSLVVLAIYIGLVFMFSNGCKKEDDSPLTVTDSVTDNDGNMYKTVKIGTQVWMAENLRTTHYNDGSAIPLKVISDVEWKNLTTPGYCWYNNDSATYSKQYGALYNWYVVETGKLCPSGWRVPTDTVWKTMENWLIANGYNFDGTTTWNKIAKSLAATTNWPVSTKTGAVGNTDYPEYRNKTGFSAIGLGARGDWFICCDAAEYWSSTSYSSNMAFGLEIHYDYIDTYRSAYVKYCGMPIRCVKE
jgi:uncharacterized protein (TIGR02145 family)